MNTKSELLKYFADFIQKQTGITYSEANYYQLENRLQSITVQFGYDSIDSLGLDCQAKGIHGGMKDLILDTATNNETSFFRDPHVFQTIVTHMIPFLQQRQNRNKIKIWSAASSTGQEAYSLAMAIEEERIQKNIFPCEMTATDISDRVLRKASAGKYTQLEVQRGLSAQRLIQFFEQNPDQSSGEIWQAKPSIKQYVKFHKLNLIENWPENHGPFDIILCRNVLIYQTIEQKKKVIDRLFNNIAEDGFLVLGGAESLANLSNSFEQKNHMGTIFYQPRLASNSNHISA